MSHYTMLSIYGQCSASSKLEASWDFCSRRIEWRPSKIVLILNRTLENAISSGNKINKQESHKSLFESLSKNTWKYRKLKYLDQIRKTTSIVSSWSRNHSPVDNCSLFIRHKEYHKQLAINKGYAAIHYSNPGVSIASSLVQQSQLAASNNFITTCAWVSEIFGDRRNSFLYCSHVCNCTKIQIHSYFDGWTSKFFLFSLSASF